MTTVNDQFGVVVFVGDDRISAIRIVRNPDKLAQFARMLEDGR